MSWGVNPGIKQSFVISGCGLMLQVKAQSDELSGKLGIDWLLEFPLCQSPKEIMNILHCIKQHVFDVWFGHARYVWLMEGIRADKDPLKIIIETSIHLLLWNRYLNGWLTFIFTYEFLVKPMCGLKANEIQRISEVLCCFAIATSLASFHGSY